MTKMIPVKISFIIEEPILDLYEVQTIGVNTIETVVVICTRRRVIDTAILLFRIFYAVLKIDG